ncbi:SgcJ/EcaC family oxidoreductase [Hymenobacter sp. RP-2-7]|uniref:SgcJ/EcaC family oxidoreductase n=1 Tax=Hymenobacter polaris TaxID=2682546 RepID=A0A7Y0AF16_9BACT|nr:SgcJ/EcaC family oxidoreductase [Hymenobacter polaris]NML66129.1 SgcJ/EcaC family oxidoreductase [Hymenobacter polaris]
MKTLVISALAALLALGHSAAAQSLLTLSAADQAGVAAALRQFGKNLNDHHFADMPGYVTPDISFVNVVGMYWQGAADVQRAHQAVFDRIYQHAVFTPADPSATVMRVVAPGVVLITSRVTPPNRSDVPAPAGGSARSLFSTLLVKRQGRWLITFCQNTPVDEQAAASNPIRMAQK